MNQYLLNRFSVKRLKSINLLYPWEPVEEVDSVAVEDYCGEVLAADAGPSKPVKQTVVGRAVVKRRNRGW